MSTSYARYLLALPLLAAGCEGKRKMNYESLNLVQVGGKVTLDGSPAAGLRVVFENPETRTHSHGITNASGEYRLSFDSNQMGCTPGRKIVRINRGGGAEEDDSKKSDDDAPAGPPIPARYNRKSELTVTVAPESATHDFAITSK
jgi:hypothetical protein